MKRITFNAPPSLDRLARKAADTWNRALEGLITLAPLPFGGDVQILFGPVDRRTQPTRVAQCEALGGKLSRHWRITLAADVKWQITPWQRFWGIGAEDAYAALLHEFGHVFGLPHSNRNDVMHPNLGTTVISPLEAENYRRYLVAGR